MNDTMPVVSLREVTEDNRADVEALAVTEEQRKYVASVADSLVGAAQFPDAKPWYRAVYADDQPVGFVMISDGITVDNPEYLGPRSPVTFYQQYGFRLTGEVHDGEPVLELDLYPG